MPKGKLPIKYEKGSLSGMIRRNNNIVHYLNGYFSNDIATWKIHHSNNVFCLNRIDDQPINNTIVLEEGKPNREDMTQVTWEKNRFRKMRTIERKTEKEKE